MSSDKAKGRISFKGKRSSIEEAKILVTRLIGEYEKLERSFSHVRSTKTPQESLKAIGHMTEVHYPKHWHRSESGYPSEKEEGRRVELNNSSQLYQEVEKLIMGTWESQKVGHGNDAGSLTLKNIAVRRIWSIEHPSLYWLYDTKRKWFCREAARDLSKFPSIKGLQSEREVVTKTLG